MEKLEQYSSKKLEQSIKQNLKPWEYFASKQHQRVKTEGEEIYTIRRKSKKVDSKPRKTSEMHRKFTFRDSSFEEQRVGSLLELKGGTRGKYVTQTEAPREKGSLGMSFGELVPRPTS